MYGYARNNPLSFGDDDGRDVIEKIIQSTYVVHGNTADEASRNALQTSGIRDENGQPMMGETSYSMSVTNEQVSVSSGVGTVATGYPGNAELKSADVNLTQTETTPSWVERSQAPPEEQQKWDSQASDLSSHEQDHQQINRQGADQLNSSLPGTRGTAVGSSPKNARSNAVTNMQSNVTKKVRSTIDKTNNQNRDLDVRTNHGREKRDED